MLTMWGGGDTQELLDVKKIELYALAGGGNANRISIRLLNQWWSVVSSTPAGGDFTFAETV